MHTYKIYLAKISLVLTQNDSFSFARGSQLTFSYLVPVQQFLARLFLEEDVKG